MRTMKLLATLIRGFTKSTTMRSRDRPLLWMMDRKGRPLILQTTLNTKLCRQIFHQPRYRNPYVLPKGISSTDRHGIRVGERGVSTNQKQEPQLRQQQIGYTPCLDINIHSILIVLGYSSPCSGTTVWLFRSARARTSALSWYRMIYRCPGR